MLEDEAGPDRGDQGHPPPNGPRRGPPGCALAAALGVVIVLGLMVAAALVGTAIDRQITPTTRGATATTTWPVGDRHTRLEVGDRRPGAIEFADANTGFVLVGSYSRQAMIFRTADGGRSWQRLPFDPGDREVRSLSVLSPTALVLSVDPGGHLVSRDGGRTFTVEEDYPTDLQAPLDRRATLRCGAHDPGDGRCLEWEVAKAGRTVPQQPPLRDDVDDVAEDAQGTIWAVASAQDGIFTAVSSDAGTTWRLLAALRTPGRIDRQRLVAAPDGGELWLLAEGSDGRISVYLAEGTTWRLVTEALRPGFEPKQPLTAGGGVLFLAGRGAGYLDRTGAWRPVTAPRDVALVSRLDDGTLTGTPPSPSEGGVWLGAGQGADRSWVYVTVEP